MKRNNLLTAVLSAMMLTACTMGSESLEVSDTPELGSQGQTPVAFSAYQGEYGTTRAGVTGPIASAAALQGVGFGVFAYYTDNGTYDSANEGPNFMYNQLVSYNSLNSVWEYSPLKFWPNETQSDNNGANPATSGSRSDLLSFLAYAPYVPHKSWTATTDIYGSRAFVKNDDDTGIYAISANTLTNDDAYIAYKTSANAGKSVDLLWGTAASGAEASPVNSGATGIGTVTTGNPFLNLSKQQINGKIKFQFHHALSRFGFDKIVAAVDLKEAIMKDGKAVYDEHGVLKSSTKVLIEKIEVTDKNNKLYVQGVLDLKNNPADTPTPNWVEKKDAKAQNFTLAVDGDSYLNARLVYEKPETGGDKIKFNDRPDGVTATEKSVMFDADKNPLYWMVIPGQADLTVKITYHVITEDENLANGEIDVTNEISKDISLDLKAGTTYKLNMVLGLTSVKLDADVTDWDTETGTTPSDLDLPQNVYVKNTDLNDPTLKGGDPIYVNDEIVAYYLEPGLAIAAEDLSVGSKTTFLWGPSGYDEGVNTAEYTWESVQANKDGYNNTEILSGKYKTDGTTYTNAKDADNNGGAYYNYEAAYYAKNNPTAAPAGGHWILPSVGQWIQLFTKAGISFTYNNDNMLSAMSTETDDTKTLNTYLASLGIPQIEANTYWSSTGSLYDAAPTTGTWPYYRAYLIGLGHSENGITNGIIISNLIDKKQPRNVRPFLVWSTE